MVRAGDAAGTPFLAARPSHGRRPAGRNGPCMAVSYRLLMLTPSGATAAAVVEEPAPQQRREKQERSSRPAHSIRRLLCSRKPTRLIPQRREFAAFSCPSIETDTARSSRGTGGRCDLAAGRCQWVLHVSEARSVFCIVTKQNVAEKNIHIPRYRFNLRACNSDPQVEQSVGINTTAGGLAHTYRSLLTDTNSRICIGQCQMTFG